MGTIWNTPNGDWAVCDGDGPTGVKGYIAQRPQGWIIIGNEAAGLFLDQETAASRILGERIQGTSEYTIERNGITNIVRTYPGVIERLKKNGWRPLGKL